MRGDQRAARGGAYESSDGGSWSSTGAAFSYPFSVLCDNAYPYNHVLDGVATLVVQNGGTPVDQFTVPYQLTEAGAVTLTAPGAYSDWFPSEQVAISGTGALTGTDSCPNQHFTWQGTIHIATAG